MREIVKSLFAHQQVTVRDASNEVVDSATTSRAGRFQVTLEPGRYTVVFVRDRNGTEKAHEATVEVEAGRTVDVRLVDRVCYCG